MNIVKKLRQKFFLWLVRTKFYKTVLLKYIPYIRFTTYYTRMKGWAYHEGYNLLREGDIILTTDSLKLTTIIIPGEWAHAGLCVSKDQKFECAEMTHNHYTKSTFADMCFQADSVMILRCRDWDEAYIQKVIAKCRSLENARYDIEFKLGEEFLYCSELIYESDIDKILDISLDDLEQLGRPYISPVGLSQCKNADVIWYYKAKKKNT